SNPDVAAFLSAGPFKTSTHVRTSVYKGIKKPPGGEDVDIWHVTPPAGKDIFDVVGALRQFALKGKERTVSPNHVLIPASAGDQPPPGPPSHYPGSVRHLPAAKPLKKGFQPVAVVDSGYQWDAKSGWGTNPLVQRGHVTHVQAYR